MSTPDPFAPPAAPVDGPPLYTANQVAGAAFVGGPLAGALALGLNERSLGRPMVGHAVTGVVATLVLIAVSFVLPEHFPGIVLPVAYTMAIRRYAAQAYPAAPGGPVGRLVLVALGSLIAMVGLVVGTTVLSILLFADGS